MGAAALRALESEKPAGVRICYDPLAGKLIDPGFYQQVRLFARISDWLTRGGSTFVVCRCRYVDDYLRGYLKNGITQVVILGAGFDTRAYRSDLISAEVKVYEVDHPATQAGKIERVTALFGQMPANVVYVPVDFNVETLDRLLAAGFDRSLKALFVWEGVTLYLDAAAIDATLAWIRANAAPGSALIFDYQDTSTLTRRNYAYALLNRLTGEKRVSGFEKGQIEAFLHQRGFTHVVDADAGQINRLYCSGPNRRRRAASYYGIVHANVGETSPD